MSSLEKTGIDELKKADLTTVIQHQKGLIAEIIEDVDRLLELSPVLQAKLREEVGLTAEPDYSALTDSLQKLTRASAPRSRPARSGSSRAASSRKPLRYALQRKSNGEAVTDEAGEPISFRTRIRVLRGPKYQELLGDQGVKDVQLVDTEQNNEVVVPDLTFGPAPGGRR